MTRRVRNPEYRPIGYKPIGGMKVKSKTMEKLAKLYLDRASELFDACDSMDTAVRDSVCEGLAFIVHAGYDCQACACAIEPFHEFIAAKTTEWFRSRGFAEWFCVGAAELFNSSKPHVMRMVLMGKPRKGGRIVKRVEVA